MSPRIRRATMVGLLGAVLGWAGSRLFIPVPEVVHLSPTVDCGAAHEVSVPMAENVSWAVQSGGSQPSWWDDKRRAWVSRPPWHVGHGKVIAGRTADGIRLVVTQPEGFTSGSFAGVSIRGVR